MKHQYKAEIRWSEADAAYVARAPELDGVITHGNSVVEAAKNLEEAIELHLESLKAHDEPIPDPIALRALNGKYALRMGRERHQDVYLSAHSEGMSVNEYILKLIDSRELLESLRKLQAAHASVEEKTKNTKVIRSNKSPQLSSLRPPPKKSHAAHSTRRKA